MTELQWRGVEDILRGIDDYERRVRVAVRAIADYLAPQFERYAKENARWIDRTGNARQGLVGLVDDTAESFVEIFIAHGMEYGLWLEVRFASRYAICWETIQAHLPMIDRLLREAFG